MPLLDIWGTNPLQIGKYNIQQIVAMAGDGDLRDDSDCSKELRAYLAQTDIPHLASYVDRCLSTAFPKNGAVLQDLVNELGRRLDYTVINGRYAGVPGKIGFDGVWKTTGGQALVVEVKTTDAYRVPLDTLAGYRMKLIEQGAITEKSSMLLVVGRQDTGELEAQIRGSRHAWDMRLISVESLVKLAELKQETDDPETVVQIRTILEPFEYTKLDRLVEIMFTTAKDVSSSPESEEPSEEHGEILTAETGSVVKKAFEFTDAKLLEDTHRGALVGYGVSHPWRLHEIPLT